MGAVACASVTAWTVPCSPTCPPHRCPTMPRSTTARAGAPAPRRRCTTRPARRLRRRPSGVVALARLGLPPVRPPALPQHGGRAGADAALLRLAGPGLPPSDRGVALTTDSNPRACALDPRRGTALALAEGVANVACVGATPVAVVNCLNFGNPEHPEVMWQLSECIDGMAEACRALSLPVIGGNVSFYNESGGRRHRSHTCARRARPRRRPPRVTARAGVVRRRHPRPGRSRRAADGFFPLDGTRWATERRDHRSGRIAVGRLRGACAASCAFVARWSRRRWPGPTATRWCTPSTTCPAAGWPSRWRRWPPRQGSAARSRSTMQRSSSRSCPRASSWRRAAPDDLCARAAAARRSRPRCSVRRAVTGCTAGRLLDLPVGGLSEAHEGNLALALGEP